MNIPAKRYTLLFVLLTFANLPAAQAQTSDRFFVDSVGDAEDANVGDGLCQTASGDCTLRAALQEVNATPNSSGASDEIFFDASLPTNVGGTGFALIDITNDELPGIDEPVLLDGYTAPGYDGTSSNPRPVVVLDGASLTSSFDEGLYIDADGTTVRGLTIINFPSSGIQIDSFTNGVTIQGCFIGLSGNGTNAAGNAEAGVFLAGGSNHTVGLVPAVDGFSGRRNVISGNTGDGLFIEGTNNKIYGNYVGTDYLGTSDVGNGDDGIDVEEGGNIIGGVSGPPGERVNGGNVVAGNADEGILIFENNDNEIAGNYIGTDESGTSEMGNGEIGIRVNGSNNTIGPDDAGIGRNVVAANGQSGIQVGVSDETRMGNVVQNNYVGLDQEGSNALNNTTKGILLLNTSGNEIAGNVISTSYDENGIEVRGNGNTVTGNFVGTNRDGMDFGNQYGIAVFGGNNEIGGTNESEGNTVGFSALEGISLQGDNNTVQGNFVGTNATGENLGGGSNGIEIFAAEGNVIGYDYGANDLSGNSGGNTIAFNSGAGVLVTQSASTQNSIRGNTIFNNDGVNTSGIGINLNGGTEDADQKTSNDIGDGDNGPNRLMNYPEIESSNYDEESDQVQISYLVDADPGNANYGSSGLKVDFYLADGESSGEGQVYIGTDLYSSASAGTVKNATFSPPSETAVTRADFVVATATDANSNTSEFSSTAQQLPVELASFTARADERAAVLTWQTATETGNDGFLVQRRRPTADVGATGRSPEWMRVAFVESKAEGGTSQEPLSYQFRAEGLDYGAHTFRLVQRDLGGGRAPVGSAQSVEIGLSGAYDLSEAFPNPFREVATVELAVREAQEVTVSVYDALGRRVRILHEGPLPAQETKRLTLRAGDLASGVYFVRVVGEDFAETRRAVLVR